MLVPQNAEMAKILTATDSFTYYDHCERPRSFIFHFASLVVPQRFIYIPYLIAPISLSSE